MVGIATDQMAAITRKDFAATEVRMFQDPETMGFLIAHQDLRVPAREVVEALLQETERDMRVNICEDPETGIQHLVFTVMTRDDASEMRAKVRDFAARRLPASAIPFKDRMIFKVGIA